MSDVFSQGASPITDYRQFAPKMPEPQKDTTREELTREDEAIRQREIEAIQAGKQKREALERVHPAVPADPRLQDMPKPKALDFTDPIKAFQNPGVLIATLGSLFTRAPMTAALNAGAAAMTAYHKGEAEVFAKKREEWKDATEAAIKQNQVELEKYNAAWKKSDRAVADKLAEMQAIAAGTKDEVLMAAIASGRVERMDKLLDARDKANLELQKELRHFEEQKEIAKIRAGGDQPSILTDQARDDAAKRYLKTGIIPSFGWGKQAGKARGEVLNRASEMAAEQGIDMGEQAKQWQKYSAAKVAIQRFESGPQGNTIRSLNVAIDHLGTVDRLARALDNNDIKLFNRIAQDFAEQTGSPAPTNLDTAKAIVGPEIIKAIGIAGAGTKEERDAAADAWNRSRSPSQLAQATQTIKALLAGQMRGLKLQFKTATQLTDEDFNSMLLPETVKQIGQLDKSDGGWTEIAPGVRVREK